MVVFDKIDDLLLTLENPFEIINAILKLLGTLLCTLVYNVISWFYQVFMTVGRLNILSNDTIEGIYQRVTMIITIIMIFYITFEFVKHIIQPENITDKEKGAPMMVLRLVGAIILIAFVPTIFSAAYTLQNKIIDNGVINKIVLGKNNVDYHTLGSEFAANTMSIFLRLNDEVCSNEEHRDKYADECTRGQIVINEQLRQMRENDEMIVLDAAIYLKKVSIPTENGGRRTYDVIKFPWLLALVGGCFIAYMLLLYGIDLARRYGQMILLQIISPVAVISFAAPNKDGIFQKWLRQCITTYLDLFIRLFIMHFVLLVISVIFDSYGSGQLFVGIDDANMWIKGSTYLVLVMGLLVFANKAPTMIQELFPSGNAASIGYGLNGKERFEPTVKIIKGLWNTAMTVASIAAGGGTGLKEGLSAIGGLGGLKEAGSAVLSSLSQGKFGEALGGMSSFFTVGKSMFNGIKAGAGKQAKPRAAIEAARSSIARDAETLESGGNPLLRSMGLGQYTTQDGKTVTTNANTWVADYERETARFETTRTAKSAVSSSLKENKAIQFIEMLQTSDAASADPVLKDRLVGNKKAAEKAGRVYATVKDDPTRSAAAYAELHSAVKDAIIGTGAVSADQENTIILGKASTGGASTIQDAIRRGTLSSSTIDSLKTTSTLTETLKSIIKKAENDRTVEEQQQVEDFIASNDSAQSALDDFIRGKIEPDSVKWDVVQTNLMSARDTATIKDRNGNVVGMGDITIKVERPDSNSPTGKSLQDVKISDLTDEEFARELGTIDDEAWKIIEARKADSTYKANKQVADSSGKK